MFMLENDRRRFMRFNTSLKVEIKNANNESLLGKIQDFSRQGLKVIFDNFNFKKNSYVDLRIQQPGNETFIPASAMVVWERSNQGKCEAGLEIKQMSPEEKSEVLEYGYKNWLEAQAAAYQAK